MRSRGAFGDRDFGRQNQQSPFRRGRRKSTFGGAFEAVDGCRAGEVTVGNFDIGEGEPRRQLAAGDDRGDGAIEFHIADVGHLEGSDEFLAGGDVGGGQGVHAPTWSDRG